MNRAFVRALWGTFAKSDIESGVATNPRPSKMQNDILAQVNPEFKHSFVTYTFGISNHKYLQDLGFDSRLVSEEPQLWDMKTELYRHKLEVFKCAMKDFDEIVFLDWDCVLIKNIPEDFWARLNQKSSFQSNLFQYRTKKCLWRKGGVDQRKVCNGGFAYIREKSIPDKFIKNWEEFKTWSINQKEKRSKKGLDLRFREKCLTFDDEPAMSKYVDDYLGEWKGEHVYWNMFEPSVCNLRKKSVYSESQNKSKDACFMHLL